MIGLLQRVTEAQVDVSGETVAAIGKGLMVLIGVERHDEAAQADRLLERVLGYRVFSDSAGKMNLSLHDVEGDLLLVPQFTLPANTDKGMRPSFTPAAAPEDGEKFFNYLMAQAREKHGAVQSGRFGAEMQVRLINDGPVTFWLQTK
jgi:D-tyrosyl-tRNA(Tyr) deacylase